MRNLTCRKFRRHRCRKWLPPFCYFISVNISKNKLKFQKGFSKRTNLSISPFDLRIIPRNVTTLRAEFQIKISPVVVQRRIKTRVNSAIDEAKKKRKKKCTTTSVKKRNVKEDTDSHLPVKAIVPFDSFLRPASTARWVSSPSRARARVSAPCVR